MQNVTNPPERGRPTGVERFVEQFAMLLAEAGMARMPARVFGALLVTEDGRLTAGELAETLRVSPAAISGAVRYLAQVGLVVRGRDPGERRDHYEVSDDLWFEVYGNRDKQMETWASLMAEGVSVVGADTRAGRRLDQSRRFFEFLKAKLPSLLDEWRDFEARDRG